MSCWLDRRRFVRSALLAAGSGVAWRLGASQSPACEAEVQTSLGRLRGVCAGGVRQFRGVPFARPPVGPLRFRPPVAATSWTGVRAADQFAASPMQNGEPGVTHSEDCLYLNIWAPAAPGPHPVFVWIHGGGFTGGHAFEPLYDGSQFAREGVVCVTVAYRLGVLGFLDLEPVLGASYAGSANNGLLDLIAALTWVQTHIADFGGDPTRVTIGGESAGAKLTDDLMGVPWAEPLFGQMISESGGAERIWLREAAAPVGEGFAAAWRTQTGLGEAALATAPAAQLIDVQTPFLAGWPQHFPLRPEVDGLLVPRLPVDTIAAGSSRGKRLLIGTNRDESALFLGAHPQQDPTAKDLGNVSLAAFDAVFARYKALYPEMPEDQLRIRAVTAEEYWIPSLRVAEAHVEAGGSAWMYRLDFTETSGRWPGEAYHSLDTGLVWDKPHPAVANASAEAALAARVHEAWVAFIRGDAPAAAGMPAWPQFRPDTRATMILDTTSRVEMDPFRSERLLWGGVL